MNRTNDKAAEVRAMHAVEKHHADMLKQLNRLVALLLEAVESRSSAAEDAARDALLGWCDSELIPHALAEEGPLYSGPRSIAEGTLLVEGMLAEHRVIVGLVEELRNSSGVSAAVAAGAIQRIFALHLDKENRLLMPLMAESAELSLANAVEGLHELVGEQSHGHHDAIQDDRKASK